jgi:hypothetical protein
MKPLFSHDTLNSFVLWWDNYLMRKGEAYKTYTSKLYYYTDTRLASTKVIYGSPYKQWVYDKGITGATIPTGFLINGTMTPTGTSGMFIDFDNGRIIFDAGVSTGLAITGTYSAKEINSYTTDQPEESLIVEGKYVTNSKYTVSSNYIAPYAPAAPAAFISIETIDNEPFAFGGEDETTIAAKAVVFCENLYQLDGVLGVFSDSFNEVFSKIPMTGHPLGEFYKLKTGAYPTGYNYTNVKNIYNNDVYFITDVTISKVRDDAVKEMNPDLNIGIIDFEFTKYRYPRLT